MLVYRGMNIGTAKPALDERRQVRHHLIDIASPRSNFSVYAYRKRALRALEEIWKRGKVPLVVGGSGLYVEALWKGLSNHPGGDAKLREKLERKVERESLASLYRELERRDPERARAIHPNDRRRIVRALEIAILSGKTSSEWYRERKSLEELGCSVQIFGIARDRGELYERINQRVERMFRKGFVEEVKRLKRRGFSKTARQALGYREILESLLRGDSEPGRRELIRLIQKRTRQFAKRQLAWFRRKAEIQWIPWGPHELVREVCDKITRELKNG